MPCLLKQRTSKSPGIITFTHSEVLFGVAKKSKKVIEYLRKTSLEKSWIYGVHIQGDCNWLTEWPLESWHNFFMWPDSNAKFLKNVNEAKILKYNCINFLPVGTPKDPIQKDWDVCIISRASDIKRICESLVILRKLLDQDPGLKFIVIVPDHRIIEHGRVNYKKYNVSKDFYDLPMKLFSSVELERISFICSPVQTFGNFPVSANFVTDILSRSKLLLLTSHQEGTPRIIAEAFLSGVPCVVSKNLMSGLNSVLNSTNTLYIEDDADLAAQSIISSLKQLDRFKIDLEAMEERFSSAKNVTKLQTVLANLISKEGKPIDGEWYLEGLHLRLAGHGRKYSFQFAHNEDLFFQWLGNVEKVSNVYDEDALMAGQVLHDGAPIYRELLEKGEKLVGKGKHLFKRHFSDLLP